MKKAVLILFALSIHLLAANKINHIEVNYHQDNDNYKMSISGKFKANYRIFLDTDNNETTGYTQTQGKKRAVGADYLIHKKGLYKYIESSDSSSWLWQKISDFSTFPTWSQTDNLIVIDLNRVNLGMGNQFKYRMYAYASVGGIDDQYPNGGELMLSYIISGDLGGETNTALIAIVQTITMEKNTNKIITLTGSDAQNDNLTFTVVTPPSHGVYDSATYTPNVGYVGSDSFTFKANDGKVDSASATVSIVVSGINVEVINGYTLPPKPDATLNNSTLLGIDSNDNGVRDDVERYIVKKYKDHHLIVTEIGFQSARAFNAVIENPANAQETYTVEDAAMDCNSYFKIYAKFFGEPVLLDHTIIIEKDFESIYLNTKERISAYLSYDLALSGGVYDLTPTDQLKSKCTFDVDALLGGGK